MSDDDLFLFGEPEPKDPEEQFCTNMLMHTKKDQLCAWLGTQISVYLYMSEDEGIKYTKSIVTEKGLIHTEVRRLDMCKKLIKYYLLLFHLPSFQKCFPKEEKHIINIDKVINIIVQDDKVKATINKDY